MSYGIDDVPLIVARTGPSFRRSAILWARSMHDIMHWDARGDTLLVNALLILLFECQTRAASAAFA